MKAYLIYILTLLFFLNCNTNVPKKNSKRLKKYKREKIRNYLNKNSYQDIELYISRTNDTIGFETKTYINNKLDSSKSKFYSMDLYKIAHKETLKIDSLGGIIKYHFDSTKEGELDNLWFFAHTKNGKQVFKSTTYKKKEIEFKFKNNNDTLMGMIYAQHRKDTIDKGEHKVRLREIIIAVDNHLETDNPFVETKL